MMIYGYEAQVLQFVNAAIPDIKEMTYSPEETLITAMTPIKYMPYMYFSRVPTDWEWNRPARVLDIPSSGGPGKAINIWNFEQKYLAKILVESNRYAFEIANRLRVWWNSHYQVNVQWLPLDGCPATPVQLRLLYIKVTDVRLPNDKIGSCRCVEFSWQSMLITSDADESLYKNITHTEIDPNVPPFLESGEPNPDYPHYIEMPYTTSVPLVEQVGFGVSGFVSIQEENALLTYKLQS